MKLKHTDIISKLTHRQKADLLSGKDFWSTVCFEELGLPSAYLSDGPHGLRKQASKSDHLGLNKSVPATCFPTAATMANSWNEQLGQLLGTALGKEALAQHVNVVLGPGLNIKRNPLCGRNFEYFSEDPFLAGKMAAAYCRGIQSNGVYSCVKHFAANNQELRRMAVDSVVDERTLREIYLTGFEIAVKEGKTGMVMTSYNLVNGAYANENSHLVKDILRTEWGFEGVVVSDWAGCNNRVEGVECGSDLEMPHCKYGCEDVFEALEAGTLDENAVDECLDRLIEFVLSTEAAIPTNCDFNIEEHHAVAQRCAEESIVLLKNDGVLPLSGSENLLVVGDFAQKPRYQGAGSSIVNPTKLDSFLDCLKQESVNFVFTKGFHRYGKKRGCLSRKAVKLAKKADRILFFAGLDEVTEAEGLDRQSLKLPKPQMELLKKLNNLNKPVIVVLSCGSAVELEEINNSNAIVHGYLGGQAGAKAMLNVLLGKVNPSGKLAESLPFNYQDCSSSAYFPGRHNTAEYREGIFVGYRYYDTANVKVNFPFGFGLSYTTFAYFDLNVSEKGVEFTLQNTGSVDGAEVVQLYIGKQNSIVPRPKKELKGFSKVFLKAGESQRVFIPFDDKSFRYFNVATNGWEIEGGEYDVFVCASVEDVRLQSQITLEGTTDISPYNKELIDVYFSADVKNVDSQVFESLLGRELPQSGYKFYKKNRMIIHPNCTVDDLRYSKSWIGRFISSFMRFTCRFLTFFGDKTNANTLTMGVIHQPIRGIAKFAGMSRRQMEGLLVLVNGHFFKGLKMLCSKGNKRKKK